MSDPRTIQVDYLSRVEGEGALTITFRGSQAHEVQLRIFEPPRFFEGFLRGRDYLEAPDITSRICGICPVAYITSACNAMEAALGIELEEGHRALRRLIYCGEWIESHALHVFMLHAPDFFGYPDAIAMAKDHGELVKRGLRMKKIGNALIERVGGRAVHPVNTRVGGFYRAPTRADLASFVTDLSWGRDAARESLRVLSKLAFPAFERDYEFVSAAQPGLYPIETGRIVSSGGMDIATDEYEQHFEETHVAHSTALHSAIRGRGPYFTGPLARFNLHHDKLSDVAREAAREAGLSAPCRNPFKSLLVRLVELVYAFDEALRLIAEYAPPSRPHVDAPVRAARGTGCCEAPRGLLYQRYTIDDRGAIVDAKIVPPTAQNQKTIEDDLYALAPALAAMSHEDATQRAEQAVRNYDPCISCSTHFLKLTIERL